MTQQDKMFLEMFRELLLIKHPPGEYALPEGALHLFNMCYSAGRIDAIKEVVEVWKKLQGTTDLSTIVLEPTQFVLLMQELIDAFCKNENKFGDLYAVKSSLILP